MEPIGFDSPDFEGYASRSCGIWRIEVMRRNPIRSPCSGRFVR